MSPREARMAHAVVVACRHLPEGVQLTVYDDGTVSVGQPLDREAVDMDAVARELRAEPASAWSYYGDGTAERTLRAMVEGVTIRLRERRRVEVAS